VLPGASPSDIESLVTVPIEDALSDIENISTVSSTSQSNASVTTLEFASGVDPDEARNDVQSAVDTVDLPKDAQTPRVIRLNFENQPVWSFVLTAKDEASLMRYARVLKDELESGDTIKEVQTPGIDEQEIMVVIDSEKSALLKRARLFRDFNGSNSEVCRALNIPEKKGWDITKARNLIRVELVLTRSTILQR